jgi:hypothetical protein
MIQVLNRRDPNARQRRADALRLARKEYGYAWRNGRHCFPLGKFECEPFEIVYFYDAMLNGFGGEILMRPDADEADCEIFELDDWDRAAFDTDATHVVLWYSSQGFVSLTYCTQEEVNKLMAEYYPEEPDNG